MENKIIFAKIANANSEVVVWQWRGRNKKTAQKLRDKLKDLGVSYDEICTDNWEVFVVVSQVDTHKIGKKHQHSNKGKQHTFETSYSPSCSENLLFFKEIRKSFQSL